MADVKKVEPEKEGLLASMHRELGIGGWIGVVLILGFILPILAVLVTPVANYLWEKSVMSFNTVAAQHTHFRPSEDGE